jgi:hypothetical protein
MRDDDVVVVIVSALFYFPDLTFTLGLEFRASCPMR